MTVSLQMEIVVKGKEDASKIFDNIKRSAGDAEVSLKKVTDTTKSNSMAFTELNSALMIARTAFNMISQVVKATVGAYMDAEDSLLRMAAAMRMSGSTSDKALESMVKFAQTMGTLTRFEDDAVLGLMSMGKAAGYTDETVKAMTLAAANLSAVTKKDLATSFDALMMSLNGQTRGIKMLLPELKNMSDEAIRGGGAINLINEKLKDAAVNEQSLSASSEKLANSFGNMMEAVGKVIVEAIDLRGIFDGLTSLFTKLGRAVESVDFRKLADGLREAIPFILSSTVALGVLLNTFTGLSTLMMGGTISQGIAKITFGLRAAWIAAAPFLLIAAKILLIVAAIVAVAVAIDQLVRNFSRLGDAWSLVWNVMQQVALRAMAMIYDKLAEIAWMFGGNASKWRDKAQQMIRDADDLKSKFKVSKDELTTNWDTGFVGKIIDAFKGVGKSAEEGGNKADLGGNKAKVALTGISEAAKKAADELKKFMDQLKEFDKETASMENESALVGKNDVEKASIRYQQSLKELNKLIADGKQFNKVKETEEKINKRIYEYGKKYTTETSDGYKKLEDEAEKYLSQIAEIGNSMNDGGITDSQKLRNSAGEQERAMNAAIAAAMDFAEKNPMQLKGHLDLKDLMDQVREFSVRMNREANQIELKAKLQPINDAVAAVSAGAKNTVSYVVSQWGPVGALIAGIIGFFDKPPNEFLNGIREFFQNLIIDMTTNLLVNIPVFIRELFRGVSKLIYLLFSDANKSAPKFIFSLIKALGDGIGQMLKDVVITILTHALGANMKQLARGIRDAWKEIFLGQKAAQDATETATKTTTVTTKYKKITDSAAGRDEFRVREYEASETTTKTWEQKVKEVTNAQEESLGTSILGLWRDFIADIREAFDWFKRAIIEITKEVTYGIIWAISSALFGVMAILGALIMATVVGPIMGIITLLTGGGIKKAMAAPAEYGQAAGDYIWSRQKKFTGWLDNKMTAQQNEVGRITSTEKPGTVFDLDGGDNQAMSLDSETQKEVSPIAEIFGDSLGEGLLGGLEQATGTSMLYNLGADMWNGFWDKTEQATTWAWSIGEKVWDGFWAKFGQLATWCQELGGKIWSGFWNFNIEAMTWARNIGGQLWSGFWNMVGAANSWAAQTGLSLWNGFWNMAIGITTWASNAGLSLWNGFWNMTSGITKWASDAGLALWNGFWNKIGEFNDTVIAKVKGWGTKIWDGFWETVNNSVNSLFSFTKFMSFGSNIWTGFWNSVTYYGGNFLGKAAEWGVGIWNGFWGRVLYVWGEVVAKFKGIGTEIVNGLLGAINRAWAFFKTIGQQIWAGVAPSAGGGGGWSTGRVAAAAATGGLSEVAGWFHNGGTVQPLHFAGGGSVPGFGFTDSVPALLTPGEHVLTQSQAAQMKQGQLGGTTVVLNISPSADVSESAIRRYLVPAVIDAIDRQSINGKRFVNNRGVY